MQPTTSPTHEPNTPEPVSDPKCTIPLSTLTTTGTANQPQQLPFPHIQNWEYILGIPPCLLVLQLLPQTISHCQHPKLYPSNRLHLHHITLSEFHIWTTYLWKWWLESCVSPSLPEDEEQTTIKNTDISFGPEDHQISNLQTSHAKAVAKVIGRSEDVLKLDTIRVQMKSNSSCCSTMHKEHDRIFSQLQVALLRSQSDKLSKIEEAEKPYY